MAAFIVRANYGETFSYTSTPYFLDVPSNHPFFKYIQKLRDEGITKGCAPNLYCPNDSVTRAQMAVFLVRAFLNEALAGNPYLSDIGHYRAYNVDKVSYDVQASIQMGGNSYYKGIKIDPDYDSIYSNNLTEVEFNIGGWYSTLSGLIGIDDNCYAATHNPSGTTVAMVEFLGDGKQLKVIELKVGDPPKEFSVNVKDVIRLTIKIISKETSGIVDIANPIIE